MNTETRKAIAEYYKNHSQAETAAHFECTKHTVCKAAAEFGVKKIRRVKRVKQIEKRSKKPIHVSDMDKTRPPLDYTPPSLAAHQHSHFVGRSI